MTAVSKKNAVNRRAFLSQTGSGLLAATLPVADSWAALSEPAAPAARPHSTVPAGAKKKIPIGVFDPVYDHLSLDQMLDKVSALGLEAMEIGTGGDPDKKNCALGDFIGGKKKARGWEEKI